MPREPVWFRALELHKLYALQELIGSGGMGQVWRAVELASGDLVALKVVDPDRCGDEQLLARLESEAAALLRLRDAGQHPNVVPIRRFHLEDDFGCLVMDFIPGRDLRTWRDEGEADLRSIVTLVAKVANAAGWCHSHGILHRDLKPGNILVHASTGEPVIVDFSIAKSEAPDLLTLTLTNEALGTAPYMAPEQIDHSRAPVSAATDVYALGSTLYELLTHVHPHPGNLTQVVRRHADEVRPAPPSALEPSVPRNLDSIVLKALAHRPGDRYADGTALAEDLERFLEGSPVAARPISRLTHLARQARRKPAFTATLAACMALGGFILWSVPRQKAQRERFALQTRLTTAMQNSVWSLQRLEEAEATLTALSGYNAPLAEQVRSRLYNDVVQDTEARLQQNLLRDEDYTWLHTMAGWLQTHQPAEAQRLSGLIAERAGRWETVAEVKAPFTDLQGLLSWSHLKPEGGLLYPQYDPGQDPLITVTKSVSVPMQLACTFVADAASYQPLTLVFYNQGTRLAAGLYKVRHLSSPVRQKMRVISPDPESYVLVLKLNNEDNLMSHIPETDLLSQPFRLTLRVEREWAEMELNGRSQLRVDSPFTLGSGQLSNYWRITWPEKVGLKHLALRTRRADVASPLEGADIAAMLGLYDQAIRLYEELRGDPLHGTEASFKTAECYLQKGEYPAAMRLWESVAQGPPSDWRDRSQIQLWVQSLVSKQGDASRHLSQLPDPLPEDLFAKFKPKHVDDVIYWYAPVGMGIAQPRVDPQVVVVAAKAFRLIRLPPVQIANRLALAHHSARLEKEADDLFRKGLKDALTARLERDDLMALTNCLDQWCRISPSECRTALAESLRQWEQKRRSDPTVQVIWHMEQARIAARAGNVRAAVHAIQQARQLQSGKVDNRIQTSFWLLAGMAYRLQDTEEQAQSAWLEARKIADTVRLKHPLHLMDSLLLHSLSRSWDLRAMGELLPDLLTKHLRGQERTAAQATIHQTFLTDPAWISTFNTVLQGERGRKFAEDYVLCRQPPRELVLEFYRLLFEQHFLSTAFPQATAEQTSRVRGIVEALVTEMAMNPRSEAAHLHAYLRAWNDRPTAQEIFPQASPYTPALIKDLHWLLQQRHEAR